MKKLLALALVFASVLDCAADLKKIESDLPYQSENSDEYISERCKLDIFAPENKADKKLPVIVWFHGGGITSGNKSGFPKLIRELNIIFVTANYRLSPKIKAATAIEDAAAAVAWTFENIEKFGGDKSKIYVGGHSAGAYLSGMVGFNPEFLKKHNLSNTDIAGLLLVSGQATSHFQVRKDLGDKRAQYAPRIDENAILWHVENKVPPVCLILGDRRIEFPERVEENELLASVLKKLKTSPYVEFHELQGFNHGDVVTAAPQLMKKFIERNEQAGPTK